MKNSSCATPPACKRPPQGKRVVILGASRYYSRSIRTAVDLGYHVIALDKNPDSPGFAVAHEAAAIDIADHTSVCALAARQRADGIVALNDFGVFSAAYTAERLNLPGVGVDAALVTLNKARLRAVWQAAGQPNPRYRAAASLDECRLAVEQIGFPVILKPADSRGGGSRGVVVVEEPSALEAAYGFSTSFYMDKTILVEEAVRGVEHSAEVLVLEGQAHVLAVADKVKTPLPARVDKNVLYPTVYDGAQRVRLTQTIARAVETVGILNGCAHLECCTLPDGQIRLFEVGARPGGGGTPQPIVSFLTGVNEMEQYLRICVGDRPTQLEALYERSCNYHFITPDPGTLRRVVGLEEIRSWDGILDADILTKPGQVIRRVQVGADRAGFIIAGGDKRDEVVALAQRAENHLRFIYDEQPGEQ